MAAGGGDGAQRSRRRSDKDQEPERKPFKVEPKQVVTAVVVVAVLAVVFFVTQTDGGAPPTEGAFVNPHAAVESWSYTVTTRSGDTGTLCADDTDPCDPERLWRLKTENATCTIRTELLLSNAGMPVVLRNVRATLNATAWGGDYTISNDTANPINLSSVWEDKGLDWDDGWWWRAEDATVSFRMEVPCDTHTASFKVRVEAVTLDGDAWDETQQARITMHREYLAKLGAAPGATPFDG